MCYFNSSIDQKPEMGLTELQSGVGKAVFLLEALGQSISLLMQLTEFIFLLIVGQVMFSDYRDCQNSLTHMDCYSLNMKCPPKTQAVTSCSLEQQFQTWGFREVSSS